jgi:hypothetical protein
MPDIEDIGRSPRLRFWCRLAAFLTIVFFLATAFFIGWMRLATDFPNYYTAALLVRKGPHNLRDYYDWTWFERQIDYAGIEPQLGAYTPQTPLTMLPMVGLTALKPIIAKRVWLVLNLGFLGATIWLLSRVTRFSPEQIWLLTFCGYYAFLFNFYYGQYYVFLLFLLTWTFYALYRHKAASGGLLAGTAFALKLYGGPLLLYLAAQRKWRAVLGMAVVIICSAALALGIFGWTGSHYYLVQILPRTLEGGSIDPYHPGVQTFSTMLSHFFVREAELNPHPVFENPWLFFFLRTLGSLAVLGFASLAVSKERGTSHRSFAFFLIAIFFLSTSTGSYSYTLLLLPLVLILENCNLRQSFLWIGWYILLTLPPYPNWLFPKVWLLLAALLALGWRQWRAIPKQWMIITAILVAVIAGYDAHQHMTAYGQEPGQRFQRVAIEPGAIFSGFPAISQAGLFYQSMQSPWYVLRWHHDGKVEQLSLAGHALRPTAPLADGPIQFELVAHGTSTMTEFDPVTRKTSASSQPAPPTGSAASPDGKWIAFTRDDARQATQLWLKSVATGKEERLTGGNCNSSSPAWELDSQAIVFASDCGRAFGLTALYRAPVKRDGQ